MYKISLELNGVVYEAAYDVIDDTLIVTFQDGSQTKVQSLGNLKPQSTAMAYLRRYAIEYEKKSAQ